MRLGSIHLMAHRVGSFWSELIESIATATEGWPFFYGYFLLDEVANRGELWGGSDVQAATYAPRLLAGRVVTLCKQNRSSLDFVPN